MLDTLFLDLARAHLERELHQFEGIGDRLRRHERHGEKRGRVRTTATTPTIRRFAECASGALPSLKSFKWMAESAGFDYDVAGRDGCAVDSIGDVRLHALPRLVSIGLR